MFQVHAVDGSNRSAYQHHLDTYFRVRHEIYVEERGWHELRRRDSKEIDAFDTSDAVHLLGIVPQHSVVAGSRLVPTIKPHLMSEVFPRLAQNGVPRQPDIFEWTRFFVVKPLREEGKSCRAAGIMYCSVQQYCLLRGIRSLTIVCEDYWLPRFTSIGWNPRQLGKPLHSNGDTIIGIMVEISDAALRATREIYQISEPVLWSKKALAAFG